MGIDLTTLDLNRIGIDFDYTSNYKNYDEPRKENIYIIDPAEFEFEFSFNSDNRKKFQYSFDLEHSFGINEQFNERKRNFEYGLGFGIRANNKLNLYYDFKKSNNFDDNGYVFEENQNIFFGNRDVNSIENNLSLNYNFDSYKSINLKIRQFWSTANYFESFYILNSYGKREISNKNINNYNPNTNFNLWNFDLGINWEFAPGSKATLLYRNNLFNQDNVSGISYYTSTKELFEKPINHQISLRINYFVDFNIFMKKKFKNIWWFQLKIFQKHTKEKEY